MPVFPRQNGRIDNLLQYLSCLFLICYVFLDFGTHYAIHYVYLIDNAVRPGDPGNKGENVTINERIDQARAGRQGDNPIDDLIRAAYYRGKHQAARVVCDEHNKRMKAMREAASKCRYHNMANAVLNAPRTGDQIYHPDYADDFTITFGDDEAKA